VLDRARGKLAEATAISVPSTAVRRRARTQCTGSQPEKLATGGSSPDDGTILLPLILVVSANGMLYHLYKIIPQYRCEI
jgi:hypothetical protein